MKKKGPCFHCGTTETPLWRNGPPGKPVLCNACGSRWRTKGTLANYTPKHCSWSTLTDSDDDRESEKFKSSYKKRPRRLKIINSAEVGETVPGGHQYTTSFENNISNSSSSGAGTSFPGSCIQPGNTNGDSISGSAQPRLWDLQIPSRKRTSNKHRSPTVEKLGRDLSLVLEEQESSCPSDPFEELLFFKRDEDPMGHIETGLGGLLLKRPLPYAEKESEASLLMAESKASSSSDTCIGDRSLVSNLGAFENTISSQSPMYLQPLKDESFSVEKVTASSSTHVTEAGTSQPTNGPIQQPHHQASEARRQSSGRLILRIPNSRNKALVRGPSKTSGLKGHSNLSQQKEF